MIASASKPIRKRRSERAHRCTFKNAYTRFFTRVQYGPNLYAGYYARRLALDPTGEGKQSVIPPKAEFMPFLIIPVNENFTLGKLILRFGAKDYCLSDKELAQQADIPDSEDRCNLRFKVGISMVALIMKQSIAEMKGSVGHEQKHVFIMLREYRKAVGKMGEAEKKYKTELECRTAATNAKKIWEKEILAAWSSQNDLNIEKYYEEMNRERPDQPLVDGLSGEPPMPGKPYPILRGSPYHGLPDGAWAQTTGWAWESWKERTIKLFGTADVDLGETRRNPQGEYFNSYFSE